MSGIYGFFTINENKKVTEQQFQSMHSWNFAYGQDGQDHILHTTWGLGCCYDNLTGRDQIPQIVLQNQNQYSVIDAIIYNKVELIEKYDLDVTLSDEEIVFTLITKYNIQKLSEINGDFCGALYNEQTREITLFRDHMGIRPLYYYQDSDFLCFSSDIRALFSLNQTKSNISEKWIFSTFSGYLNKDLFSTEYNNIKCILPASYSLFCKSEDEILTCDHLYWIVGHQKYSYHSEREYIEKLRDLISDSVKRRADVIPGLLGSELSGGLDSGVISILLHRLQRDCTYFSWSVDPAEVPLAENDERSIIQDICNQENITCDYGKMVINLDNDSNIANCMQKIGYTLTDEPPIIRYAFPPYINTLPICEAAQYINRKGAHVVFSGHGGDEGVSHRCSPYEMFYHHEYYHYLRYMWSTTHGQKNRILKTLKANHSTLKQARQYLKKTFHMSYSAPELLHPDFVAKYSNIKMPNSSFAFDTIQYIKQGGSRNRLDITALFGAYSGVRYLFPYLDYRVIDYAVSIPRYLYLKGRRNRYIFREAFKDIIPKSLYTVMVKEDNSRKNMPPTSDWYDSHVQRRLRIVNALNREYWNNYLNFDFIDHWMQEDRPSDEDRNQEEARVDLLNLCLIAQNMIEKSKTL